MRTLIASRRTVVATTVGLAMALSLGGCSQADVGCSLAFIDGYLVADNGRVVLLRPTTTPMPLDWPDFWTVRPTDDGQLEVVDVTGTVRARTGEGIVLSAVGDPGTGGPWIRDGELVVCPYEWPYDYLRTKVPPDGDAP